MSVQIIHDSEGKTAGIFIPISDWEMLKKQHKDLEVLEYEIPSKEQILSELKQAVIELQMIERGELKSRPVQQLLDEL